MTSSPSTMIGRFERLRSATCSTARSSVMLIFSPANIRSRQPSTSACARQVAQQAHRLVGDAVLGVVEEEVVQIAARTARSARVAGEQVAQMHAAVPRSALEAPSTPPSW